MNLTLKTIFVGVIFALLAACAGEEHKTFVKGETAGGGIPVSAPAEETSAQAGPRIPEEEDEAAVNPQERIEGLENSALSHNGWGQDIRIDPSFLAGRELVVEIHR